MGSPENTCTLSNDKLLLFFPKQPDPKWIRKIQDRYPGLKIDWAASVREDGQEVKFEELPAQYWKDLTMIFVDWLAPPAHLLTKVRFVQIASAGADLWHDHPIYLNKDIAFCNASGAYSPQIAEWVIGTWLMSQRQLIQYQRQMEEGAWDTSCASYSQDSHGCRMGVLGYGSIGRQCARIAKAMGMEIYAYTRSKRSTPEARKDDIFRHYLVQNTGDPDGSIPSKWFYGSSKESINSFLAQDLDIVVISLPLTTETEKLISSEQFGILGKKKTFVTNVSRGRLIDTEALITALEKGQIRGAALDVTDPEPLPRGHPLWKARNVYIAPHISWFTATTWDRSIEILETNLERLNNNVPLMNYFGSRH